MVVKTKGHQMLNGDTRAREHVAARDKLWGQVEGPSGQRLCVKLVGHWYYFLTSSNNGPGQCEAPKAAVAGALPCV